MRTPQDLEPPARPRSPLPDLLIADAKSSTNEVYTDVDNQFKLVRFQPEYAFPQYTAGNGGRASVCDATPIMLLN